MSYMAMKEQLQDGCGFKVKHVYVDEHDYNCANAMRKKEAGFVEMVRKALAEAMREGIKANSIVINENMVKVPDFMFRDSMGHVHFAPKMLCGLNVCFTKDELPEGYSFAVFEAEGSKNRLEQFESIGMEPGELRKAAELYRRIKEVME